MVVTRRLSGQEGENMERCESKDTQSQLDMRKTKMSTTEKCVDTDTRQVVWYQGVEGYQRQKGEEEK